MSSPLCTSTELLLRLIVSVVLRHWTTLLCCVTSSNASNFLQISPFDGLVVATGVLKRWNEGPGCQKAAHEKIDFASHGSLVTFQRLTWDSYT
jgi:hypothetical protein